MGAFIPINSTTSIGYYHIGEIVLNREELVFHYITKSGHDYTVKCKDQAEFDSRLDDLVSFGVSPASVKALSDGKVSPDGLLPRKFLIDALDLGLTATIKNGKLTFDLKEFYNADIELDEVIETGAEVLGQKEYKYTFQVNALPNSTEEFTPVNLPADVRVTDIKGYAYNPSLDVTIPLPYSDKVTMYHSGSQNTVHPRTLSITSTEDYSGFSAVITITYTRAE